jgi:hypothetical protein
LDKSFHLEHSPTHSNRPRRRNRLVLAIEQSLACRSPALRQRFIPVSKFSNQRLIPVSKFSNQRIIPVSKFSNQRIIRSRFNLPSNPHRARQCRASHCLATLSRTPGRHPCGITSRHPNNLRHNTNNRSTFRPNNKRRRNQTIRSSMFSHIKPPPTFRVKIRGSAEHCRQAPPRAPTQIIQHRNPRITRQFKLRTTAPVDKTGRQMQRPTDLTFLRHKLHK